MAGWRGQTGTRRGRGAGNNILWLEVTPGTATKHRDPARRCDTTIRPQTAGKTGRLNGPAIPGCNDFCLDCRWAAQTVCWAWGQCRPRFPSQSLRQDIFPRKWSCPSRGITRAYPMLPPITIRHRGAFFRADFLQARPGLKEASPALVCCSPRASSLNGQRRARGNQ